MSITLLNTSQILNYTIPTGLFTPNGLKISGDVNFLTPISGISGAFSNLAANNLVVTGAIISPYLSGILGTTVTGSGIVEFLSSVDSSGNNVHFRHVISTGNPSNPIMAFSSQDSQADWSYFQTSNWNTFPALGLDSSQQVSSLVKHDFKATGMNIFQRYFSHLQVIYAGNITGNYVNSVEFQSPSAGFTVLHIPFLQEYFSTADSRYVRKIQVGSNFLASGAQISGLPLTIETFDAVPAASGIYATGRAIVVSGHLYIYDVTPTFTGFRATVGTTGFAVPTGGVPLTPGVLMVSGDGQIQTKIIGSDQLIISGGGVNQFGIFASPFKQGNLILSGNGGTTLTSVSTTSGTLISVSGGVTSFGIPTGTFRNGNLIFSGEGGLGLREVLTNTGTVIVFSGGGGGSGTSLTGFAGVTGIGIGGMSVLRQSGFLFSGSGATVVSTGAFANGILPITITSPNTLVGAVTGLGITGASPSYISGAVALIPSGSVVMAYSGNNIIIGATSSASSLPTVTGIGVPGMSALATGGFLFTGSGSTTITTGSSTNGILQIIVNSTSSAGGGGGVTGIGITGATPPYISGGVALIPSGNIRMAYSGNNIIIGTPPAVATLSYATITSTDLALSNSFLITLTGNTILDVPTNGVEGSQAKWKFFASGSGRNVTLTGNYSIPSGSTLSGTFNIGSGSTTILMAEKYGVKWLVESYVSGYY